MLIAGEPVASARTALVLVHGRGATAASILPLGAELAPMGMALLAPQAAGHAWYPQSFLAPLEANEPRLSSGLARLEELVTTLEQEGIPPRRTALLGFSQGACLTLEHAARHPRRYGAVVAFTGGLIGPPRTAWGNGGSLEGTPVFLGAGDPDPHVPWWRVEETAEALTGMGARVTLRRYPGMEHTINDDEAARARRLLAALDADGPSEQAPTDS